MNKQLKIALTKGRLEDSTVMLLKKAGFDTSSLENKGRRLVHPINKNGVTLQVVLVKAADVITYIEHGVCDIGIVGKDTILETGHSFYEVFDLGFGKCQFALAGKKGVDFYKGHQVKTIATKYPNVARAWFDKKGIEVDIIKIEGSVELAPILGLADAIVDIVETGSTLKENGLEVFETMHQISARVIVNIAGMKLKKSAIEEFVSELKIGCES